MCPPGSHWNARIKHCVPWLGTPPPPPPAVQWAAAGYGAAAGSSFDCNTVWADAEEGGRTGQYQAARTSLLATDQCKNDPASCEIALASINQQISNANFRGGKAADAIRGALDELGYGPLQRGVMWGGADQAAWKKFTADHNLPSGPGLVNKAGICQLETELKGGGGVGVGKAGAGLWWLLGLIVAGAATVALVSGKKRTQPTTGKAIVRKS
jgi:hypothetical protein